MKDNDFDEKKMLKTVSITLEHLEKALECDNEKLRKRIEAISKTMDKVQENPNKKVVKKAVKKAGITSEFFNVALIPTCNMFKNALDFDDNELREFIELWIKNVRIAMGFLFGAEK